MPALRRGTGRRLHHRGRGRGGAGDRRGGRGAVPGPDRVPGPYAPRARGHRRRLAAPGPGPPGLEPARGRRGLPGHGRDRPGRLADTLRGLMGHPSGCSR
ncbi:hypothetical protein NOCARDAX2BIS_210126 [Nocardioides sp. AX2bis]|nr:hypothetical protein NOCARDAX2BIS_210126 [Nocardioides sp. AX2bis]